MAAEEGVTSIEYALIALVIAIAIIFPLRVVATELDSVFKIIINALKSV